MRRKQVLDNLESLFYSTTIAMVAVTLLCLGFKVFMIPCVVILMVLMICLVVTSFIPRGK